MRLRSREFEGQFDPGQSLLVFSWPRHSEYTIDSAGNIKGEGYDGDAYLPLEDSDLFLSFIRLGAQAQPSDKSILRWSEGYGLLRRDDESVTVFDFQEEVRCARQLATLYTDIRQGDSAAIWARYMGEGEHRESQHHTNPIDKYFATFQRDESFRFKLEPPEDPVHLKSGVAAFEWLLEKLIEYVPLQVLSDAIVMHDDDGTLHLHSWEPHEPYRPLLSWRCRDLRSAIYLQFALMATGGKPWRKCANPHCRTPFPAKPRNKKFCKPGCRSTGRNFPH